MRITVFGGTGTVGSAAVRQLRAQGVQVRIATRDPERARATVAREEDEIARVDAATGEGLAASLAGADAAFVAIDSPAEDRCVEHILAAATVAGVRRVLYISGATVRAENAFFPLVAGKLRAEAMLARAELPWTVLAPGWIYETLARFVRGGRASAIGRDRRAYHWLAADDLGRMAARLLREGGSGNQRYIVHGPEVMRLGDALRRYCAALHPEIRRVSHPPGVLLRWLARGNRNPGLKAALDLMAYFEKVGEPGVPANAVALMGGPLTTFDEWLAQQARSRRSGSGDGRRPERALT